MNARIPASIKLVSLFIARAQVLLCGTLESLEWLQIYAADVAEAVHAR